MVQDDGLTAYVGSFLGARNELVSCPFNFQFFFNTRLISVYLFFCQKMLNHSLFIVYLTKRNIF